MIKNISNLGDASVYCDFGSEVNENINSEVIKYFNYLSQLVKNNKIEGITNLSPSYNKLIISFDLSLTTFSNIKNSLEKIQIENEIKHQSKNIKIPVCCEDKYGLDFERLSKKLKLNKKEILNFYFSKEYFCYMTGFIAGMPFLGDLKKNIRCDRLETPRVKVPEGSVGITEQFANIYTFESPGGWNIIGKTPKKIFIKNQIENPALIKPGDRVIFYEITEKEFLNWNE